AEEIKITIGSAYPLGEESTLEVKGRDLVTGLPKTAKISSTELTEVLMEPAKAILESVHMVLERTPPELVADISRNGIVMSGGGSLLYGFDKLVEEDTGIRTVVVDDPVSCAAYGAGKMLLNLNEMQDGMVNFARKRQLNK
ncbi:MAG: rod shape-determining protein, partial [Clostridia bacterium]|nr:rod shape-determining protein [Clostridia bacterium]